MKSSITTLIVLAAGVMALGAWNDGKGDVTVAVTASRSIQSCPCNGEERVVNPIGRDEAAQPFGHPARPFGPFSPHFGPPFPGVTIQAGPIVVVYSDAETVTTKTGVVLQIGPTRGPKTTRTIWPDPLPSNGWGWNTGVVTKTTTINGPAPPDFNPEPWSDWFKPPHPGDPSSPTSTTTSISSVSSSTATSSSASSSTSSTSGNNGVGPTGGSTSSTLTSSSSTILSTSSSSLSLSTSSTSSTSTGLSNTAIAKSSNSLSRGTSTTLSSSNTISPIGGSTSASSTFSTSFTTSSISASSLSSSSTSHPTSSTTPYSSTSSTLSTTSTSSVSTTSASTTGTAINATITTDVSSLSYIDGILLAHNLHRVNHTAQNLTWSINLASIAAEIAASCYYGHNTTAGGGGYGQNIGAGQTPAQVPAMIGNSMYNTEMPDYPLPYGQNTVDTTNFANWGHFSQIVWRDTQEVGCATQQCPNGVENTQSNVAPYFTVCNYSPPGNIQGAYSQVGAPLGQSIVVITPS